MPSAFGGGRLSRAGKAIVASGAGNPNDEHAPAGGCEKSEYGRHPSA
jgi:hypothetical protein